MDLVEAVIEAGVVGLLPGEGGIQFGEPLLPVLSVQMVEHPHVDDV
jgi:hypothetical protein